jgi:putative transposase
MRASRFSEEPILHLLHQVERGEQPIGVLCRAHGISEQTFYRWRQKFGGMTVADTQRLRELEKANARLQRLLAERDLEVDALKVLLAKKSSRWRPAVRPSNSWSPGDSRRAAPVSCCSCGARRSATRLARSADAFRRRLLETPSPRGGQKTPEAADGRAHHSLSTAPSGRPGPTPDGVGVYWISLARRNVAPGPCRPLRCRYRCHG